MLHDDDLSGGGAGAQDYFYALQNLYSVAHLLSADGWPVETYVYDAYGKVRTQRIFDVDNDSDIDLDDFAVFQSCFDPDNVDAFCELMDGDADGDVDLDDAVDIATSLAGPGTTTPLTGRTSKSKYFFTGRPQNLEHTGMPPLQYNRARYVGLNHGAWYQRDPLETAEGVNLYAYASSSPALRMDPFGLISIWRKSSTDLSNMAVQKCRRMIKNHNPEEPQKKRKFIELDKESKMGEDCEGETKAAKGTPMVNWLMGQFNGACSKPDIVCGCCEWYKDGKEISIPTVLGSFPIPNKPCNSLSPDMRRVSLCWNNISRNKNAKKRSMKFQKTLIHELKHALQQCNNRQYL